MKFERYTFLEFFDEEETINKSAEVSRFSLALKDSLQFSLQVFPQEDKAQLSLTQKQTQLPIFQFDVNNVKQIRCDDEKLYFYKSVIKTQDQDPALISPDFEIQIKPRVTLNITLNFGESWLW